MRMKSIPIQYILKNWYFKDLKIFCESDVLIPRPESEKIVDIVQGKEKLNQKMLRDIE